MSYYPDNFIDFLRYKLAKDQSECEHDWHDYILLSLPAKIQCVKCMAIKKMIAK